MLFRVGAYNKEQGDQVDECSFCSISSRELTFGQRKQQECSAGFGTLRLCVSEVLSEINCNCGEQKRGWEVGRLLQRRKISERTVERQEPVQVMEDAEEKGLKKATTACVAQ